MYSGVCYDDDNNKYRHEIEEKLRITFKLAISYVSLDVQCVHIETKYFLVMTSDKHLIFIFLL